MKVADLQIRNNLQKIQPQPGIKPDSTVRTPAESTQIPHRSFADILSDVSHEKQELKFSAHAIRRIDERNVQLSATDLQRLEGGVKQVEEKGARSSLILVDDMAYIVSVKNKTVVTAVDKQASMGNVFTNIDSVAIV